MRPRLSSLQIREILGVLFLLAALLGLLGILSHAGSILGAIRDGMIAAFGVAWFVPVAAALALGAYLLWPKAPRPRTIDVSFEPAGTEDWVGARVNRPITTGDRLWTDQDARAVAHEAARRVASREPNITPSD